MVRYLLLMRIRGPVLAGGKRGGVSTDWVESLLNAVGQSVQSGLATYFKKLGTN
jgi:hypothetical protein